MRFVSLSTYRVIGLSEKTKKLGPKYYNIVTGVKAGKVPSGGVFNVFRFFPCLV